MPDDLRSWILMAEIFEPGRFNLGIALEHFLVRIEELRAWDDEAVAGELEQMLQEGLVIREGIHYRSTYEGQVARERIAQAEGARASCLLTQDQYDAEDLALSVVVAPHIDGRAHQVETDDTLNVYLHARKPDLPGATDALLRDGYAREVEGHGIRHSRGYHPTSKGMRRYDGSVRERLGIAKGRSVLDPSTDESGADEPSPFKALCFDKRIGDGAYADVWKAHDPVLDRDVAVKIFAVAEPIDPGPLQHARALARVRHPNVVVVHEVVTTRHPASPDEVVEAVIMELIEGESLGARLTRGGIFSVSDARRIGHAILHGVAAIHATGIGHCDLHEGNVLLDETVGAKVIDILNRRPSADISTRTRQDDVARDVEETRHLLGLLIQHTHISFDALFAYRQVTKLVRDLEGIRAAFESALEAPTS